MRNPDLNVPFLAKLRARNVLSFGPDSLEIELGPLNVLIGPNGSGKSNLIEIISFLQGCPTDIQKTTRVGGGVQEWIWKGTPRADAEIDIVVSSPGSPQRLRHVVSFRAEDQMFRLSDERIEDEHTVPGSITYFYYNYKHGQPIILASSDEQLFAQIAAMREHIIEARAIATDRAAGKETPTLPDFPSNDHRTRRQLTRDTVDLDMSILSQRRDPEQYPEISYLAEQYSRMRIYRDWSFGRNSVARQPQKSDGRRDRLEEDFTNLGMRLNRLRLDVKAKAAVLGHLRDIYDGVSDFEINVDGGTVQVILTEGEYQIPATRLSDGTLRYLCLLAILCDPSPPPLICIEEPELGLHPDVLHKVADLLVDASTRTQVIATTHSEIIVDAMTARPEAVIVCEKHHGQTEMRRLGAEKLKIWLDEYRLGHLWLSGELGGVRW
ncbi:MAG: AAA family ATPase [Capsulimonadaceae bacterium]